MHKFKIKWINKSFHRNLQEINNNIHTVWYSKFPLKCSRQRKNNNVGIVEVSKETHKYSAAVLTAFEQGRQRCVQTLPRMLSLRLRLRGDDGFLCRQRGEIEGGTGSNDKLCMPPLKRKTERKNNRKNAHFCEVCHFLKAQLITGNVRRPCESLRSI